MKLHDIPLLSTSSHGSHLREFKDDKLGFLRRVVRECGPIARGRILGTDVVVVSGPELVHEVLVTRARAFDKAASTRLILYPLAGEGLFTSREELWRRQRKLMAPMFQPSLIAGFAASMTDAARRGARDLRDGTTIEVAALTTRIAMSIVGKTLFDADTFDEADELGSALASALGWVDGQAASRGVWVQLMVRLGLERLAEGARAPARDVMLRMVQWLEMPVAYRMPHERRIRRAVRTIDQRIARMIEDRRAVGLERPDLLSQLLRARDESDGRGMSDRQVRDEAVTAFVAGHETTATGLAWAFHHLAQDPATYERVRREGDVLAGGAPGVAELRALGTSLRVFKESLRMYPPVYVLTRQAVDDVEVGGYALPRRTFVLISAYGVHHNPDVYPDPERFDPDRFLPEAEAARHRSAWIPFGSGPRVCIGNSFALLEGQLVLASLSREVTFEPTPGADVRPDPRATLRPRGGVPMIVRRRHPTATSRPSDRDS